MVWCVVWLGVVCCVVVIIWRLVGIIYVCSSCCCSRALEGFQMDPCSIGADSCFWSPRLPDSQLTLSLALPNRVYVLACDNGTYVGVEHKSRVGSRIRDHFAGRGAAYTKHHKPTEVLGIWTAQHTAAEGYIFALLLSTMGAGSVHRLGGYTQTSVWPSPLCKQQYEEQRRLLRNLCFRCGGNHWAKDCRKAISGIEYKCPSCQGRILISSRGQSVVGGDGDMHQGVVRPMSTAAAASASQLSPPPPQVRASVVPALPELRVAKRVREAAAQSSPSKAAKTSDHAGKIVLVCGRKYTAISWYCGQQNPPPKLCRRIRDECSGRALELRHGDLRSLVQHGFAGLRPKELLPGRKRIGHAWLTTEVLCDRHALELRLAVAPLKSNRQVVFLLADVEAAGV